jgi:cytochrome P450
LVEVFEGDRVLRNDDGTVTLVRMADIQELNRHRSVLGLGSVGRADPYRRFIPLEVDGDEHRMWRHVLDPVFAPRRIGELEPAIRQRARDLLDDFADRGHAEVYSEFCAPLPQTIFLELMGLPVTDLHILAPTAPPDRDGMTPEDLDQQEEEYGRHNDYLKDAVEERMASGEKRTDLLGWLIELEVDGRPIAVEEILDIAAGLIAGGLGTIGATLSVFLTRLATHPEERKVLVDDPTLWRQAIEEYLRFESPVSWTFRTPSEDIVIGGETIKAGTLVFISLITANTDPEAFDDPLTVDFNREPNAHIAFQSGFHRCIGSHLARLELRVALEEFHARIPDYRLADGHEPSYTPLLRETTPLPLVW